MNWLRRADRYGRRSEPQMPEAMTLTTTWPGPGRGSGNSLSSTVRLPANRTPCTALSLLGWSLAQHDAKARRGAAQRLEGAIAPDVEADPEVEVDAASAPDRERAEGRLGRQAQDLLERRAEPALSLQRQALLDLRPLLGVDLD